MTSPQIINNLQRIFNQDNQRLVFWYDDGGELEECLESLTLDGVKILRLDQVGALKAKIILEMEDTTDKYLIYSPTAEPALEDDWLANIRLYSRTFFADSASIILGELELTHHAMRAHIKKHQAFFSNQDRLSRLKKWVRPKDLESELDLKMLAVLAKADQPEIFNILMKLLSGFCVQGQCDFRQLPIAWQEIEKYELSVAFWNFMENTFGYKADAPSLKDLLLQIFVADFAQKLKGDLPVSLQRFSLKNKTLALNAFVFLDQWRSNFKNFADYNLLSEQIFAELCLDKQFNNLKSDSLTDVMTFEEVERRLISYLRDRIIKTKDITCAELKEIIDSRRNGHWANPLSGSESGKFYQNTYSALQIAAELLDLRKKYQHGFSYPYATAMFDAYVNELFRFDQLYRLFHEAADIVQLQGWDVLKQALDCVENCYSGWFVDQMAIVWGNFINDGLLSTWRLPNIAKQQDFFINCVEPMLRKSPQAKIYVIISDAFRFEAAQELVSELNKKNRFEAALDYRLGVLPSYTALGMAALLPHKKLEYKANSDTILVDGQAASTLEQRSNILSKHQGTAVKAESLLSMSKDDGRTFVKPWRIIYVYQNIIDATGDAANSETKTFNAVRDAINELSSTVSYIINNLNGSQVFITADHGFLFQQSPPEIQDKSSLEAKPSGVLKNKKRYILGTGLGENPSVWHGKTCITAGTDGNMEFWLPKGANRFHFVGGARFIHGGALLQEIVIPVVSVKGLRGQAAEKAAIRKVGISILGSVQKIVNNIQHFEFIQTEPVSERVLPRNLLICIRDGEKSISNEVVLTFDSNSPTLNEERKKTAKLLIKAGQYDKKQEYALLVLDKEDKIEYLRVPVTIDLAFAGDF